MSDATAPLKVLLVDDNSDHQFLTRRAARSLERELALQIETVVDGEEALDSMKRERPALLMLDIKMPRRDGFEVLEALRREPWRAQLVVIVFSSSENGSDITRATMLGADAFVTKPMDATDFANAVRSTLQQWAPVARSRATSRS